MVRAAYNSQAYKFNGFMQNGLFGSDSLVNLAPDFPRRFVPLQISDRSRELHCIFEARNDWREIHTIDLAAFRQYLAAAHTDPKETICEAIRGLGRTQIAEQLFARHLADDRYVRARPGVLLLYMCSLKSLHMFTLWIGKLDCRAGVT